MVNERYESIILEEVVPVYTSYIFNLELSNQTGRELSCKRPKANKMKVRSVEFKTWKLEGKCYKCFNNGKDMKYKDCKDHNLEDKVSVKAIIIVSASSYLDFINACSTTSGISGNY